MPPEKGFRKGYHFLRGYLRADGTALSPEGAQPATLPPGHMPSMGCRPEQVSPLLHADPGGHRLLGTGPNSRRTTGMWRKQRTQEVRPGHHFWPSPGSIPTQAAAGSQGVSCSLRDGDGRSVHNNPADPDFQRASIKTTWQEEERASLLHAALSFLPTVRHLMKMELSAPCPLTHV